MEMPLPSGANRQIGAVKRAAFEARALPRLGVSVEAPISSYTETTS